MKNSTNGAVIIGGDFQGLGIARNLAPLDIPVIIVDTRFCIGRVSRYTDRYFSSPPLTDPEGFVDFLIRLAFEEGMKKWVLFPTSDRAVFILSKYRDRLSEYYLVPTPPWEITRLAYDKKLTHRLAEKLEIPAPITFFPQDLEELKDLVLDFPVILKPSVIANFFPVVKRKALPVRNRNELMEGYRYMSSIIPKDEIMVQEIIGGGAKNLYSFCSLFREGVVKAKIMARRLRQHPMDFGSATTFALTCEEPELERMSVRLLENIHYYGLSEVEFMFDQKDRTFKLLEINPRTWGWHTLGAKAGVNFSALLFMDMNDRSVSVDSFEKGVKWIREITDLPTVLTELIKKRMKIREYIESVRGKKELAVYSRRDPLPFVAELFLAPAMWYRRGFRS
ncbi:MAG: D-aspartate ligase [Syntrophorhabdaceae bacterium PtaU1.Bin034]|jgi:predicted ATP-grasp superfamily ATP-dependent carboligase|nr:MAG: D-aspartate ligase [Syntrophorhabdaceae bacterium PtaU1.Bin034]